MNYTELKEKIINIKKSLDKYNPNNDEKRHL